MVWAGRDSKDHLVPTPLPWAGTPSTRPGCSEEVLHLSDLFVAFLWTHFNRSISSLCWELQSQMQNSRWALTRMEQRGRIPSLDLLPTLLLMQPRAQMAFWTVSAHCQVMLSFVYGTFSQVLFLRTQKKRRYYTLWTLWKGERKWVAWDFRGTSGEI